ncbi:MAG: cytidylate kinase family protein [bacterium]|nr:cytidylate kinase family protein [bacterium]
MGEEHGVAIICISRGSASGGMLLAEKLATRLGYELLGREDIIREASRLGVSEQILQEAVLKPLSFWDRFHDERRRYLAFIQAALCEHAMQDGIVYHGNAGHLLLHGVAHFLCIRLIAPLSFRVRMVMERHGLSREESVRYIETVDRQRQNWTRFLYGIDGLDASLYDLTINLKTLDLDGAVEVATAAARRPEFEPTSQSRQSMADLLLASRVRVALAVNEKTAAGAVEVRAESGVVYLSGKLRPASMVDAVIETARKVEGVREVNRQDLGAPEFTV